MPRYSALTKKLPSIAVGLPTKPTTVPQPKREKFNGILINAEMINVSTVQITSHVFEKTLKLIIPAHPRLYP